MVKLIIVRHGYSVANQERKFSGQMDTPLTEIGVKQAIETADHVLNNYKIDKIYSSDLSRAVKTAELVSNATGIDIILDKNLRELDVGSWQNKAIADVKKEFPTSFELYKTNVGRGHPDGGEKFSDFIDRVKNAVTKIALDSEGKTIFVSTHGGVIRALRSALNNCSLDDVINIPHVANSSITVLEYDNGKWEFTLIGHDEHLTEKSSEFAVQ